MATSSSGLSQTKDLLIYGSLGALLGVGVSKLLDYIKSQQTKIHTVTAKDRFLFGTDDYKRIVNEQLVRNLQFFGKEAQDKISNAFVIVAGAGGIGSHVVSSIVRSGVKKIRIIDPGYITPTTLNKHGFAITSDIGKSKVDCCAEFALKVFPHVEVEIYKGSISQKNVHELLHGNPSYVVDCMDDVESKTVLIDYCLTQKIKVITACETSMKANPTMIQIKDITDVMYDGRARALRMQLRERGWFKGGVKVVFSIERPLREHSFGEIISQKGWFSEEKVAPTFGTMIALIGYSVASYVLCDLAGQMYTPRVMDDVKSNDYEKLYKYLIQDEKKRGVREENLMVDIEDVYILAREVFDWTCVITGKKFYNLEIVRWDPKKKASIRNLVIMSQEAAKKHREYTDITGKYDNELTKVIDEKFHYLEEILRKRGPLYKL